jgi:thiosulfate dehydrogenase
MTMRRLISPGAALLAVALVACDRDVPAADYGAKLFDDPTLSTSPFNRFACGTCHAADPDQPGVLPDRLDSGYNLGNVASRPLWWGGEEIHLLDAVNVCLTQFMGGGALRGDEDRARQLYAFLDRKSPQPSTPALPLTVVRDVTALEGMTGETTRGALVWVGACQRCHGNIHDGAGRLGTQPTVVPEDTQKTFGTMARAVVVEKIRHGRFFNIGGVMPLYSVETISDAQIADLLAYLGL